MFGCLSLLQVTPGRLFLPLLVLMHAGVALFIKTKRALSRTHADVTRIVQATYALMAMYLPIVFAKLLDRVGIVRMYRPSLLAATIVLAALAALLVAYSIRCIRRCGIA